ncbi:ABC transporter substrate-binding protein [Paenibacillus lautus]|uniref:ABC transporter substrate-binding protein n=1 Tax=Paenibacillus lautus TaxID=1401 RepID=A0A385TPR0_PAELA|nr:ABC transporter substrate-binding protein [Paenibacillus lautus]AYB43105.1 ABC transporter substrate-binding protein [Paenibacillus lautus]MBY0158700.1 ABC transporter substrate-binding protein [Cytobacillus firmus]VTR21563.1 Probable siderophore-binding lipoprotein yfiY precursor [Actinobacillus pleuropneumoniae]
MAKRFNRGKRMWRNNIAALACCAVIIGLLSGCGGKAETEAPGGDQEATKTAAVETSGKAGSGQASTEEPGTNREETSTKEERTVTDELGHEVKIPAEVNKVFAPNMEDSLLKLGVKPVAQWANGKLGHSYLQEELDGIPLIDFSGGLPSPEALMSYEPDLIVLHTETYAADGTYEKYAKIAPTYVFKNASGNVEKSLSTLGDLLGKASEAETALKNYQQKASEAKAKLSSVVGDKNVAIIRFAPRGVSLMGGNYLCGYVIHQDLGLGKSKLVENENAANLSLEILPQLDADYIFVINAYDQGTERMKEMTESPIWKGMPAVKNGQVYEADNEYWLGSGLIAYEKIVDDVVRSITGQ